MTAIPFSEVVERHGPMVWRVCSAVTGPVDADDAWSETFLAALRAYPRLPGDADVRAWLATIAHRKAVDVVRARGRRATPVAQVPDVADEAPDHAPLWRALGRLSPRQRQAVALHHLAGFSHAEAAAVLGISHDAARRASADGIAALRNDMTRDET